MDPIPLTRGGLALLPPVLTLLTLFGSFLKTDDNLEKENCLHFLSCRCRIPVLRSAASEVGRVGSFWEEERDESVDELPVEELPVESREAVVAAESADEEVLEEGRRVGTREFRREWRGRRWPLQKSSSAGQSAMEDLRGEIEMVNSKSEEEDEEKEFLGDNGEIREWDLVIGSLFFSIFCIFDFLHEQRRR